MIYTIPQVFMSSVGRERGSSQPHLIDVIQRTDDLGVLAPLSGVIENIGTVPFTLTCSSSNDNGLTDAYGAVTFRIDGGGAATIVVQPRARREFQIEGVTKPFLLFKTLESNVGGRMTLNYTAGALQSARLPRSLPAAPSSLALAVTGPGITLTWTDNSDDEENFYVFRSLDGTTYAQIATLGVGATSYLDTSVAPDTTYYYQVGANNMNGLSALTSAVNKKSAPAAPSSLAATQFSDARIDLTWVDNSTSEANFSVEHSLDGLTSWGVVASPAANATSVSISSGLVEGIIHFFRIRAIGPDGNSNYSAIASAYTKVSAPSGLAIGHTVAHQLDLTWTDNSTHESGFSVERSPDGTTGWVSVGTPAANAVSFSNTGLTTGNHWYYRVKATSPSGDSAYSGIVNDTVA